MKLVHAVSERDFQETVIELAQLNGWRIHHARPAMNRRGQWRTHLQGDPGFPDLVLVRSPRVLFVELKGERGRVSVAQRSWETALAGCPVEYYLWRPSSWPIVERVLGSSGSGEAS